MRCQELADRLDLEVVEVFVDNDLSASSGKRRPGFEALMAAIETGRVEAVVTRHVDRLYRRSRDLLRYIDVCQAAKVPTHQVMTGGALDLTTASGRLHARTAGAFAEYEVEAKGERHKAANAARATRGAVALVRRPFGYDLTIEHLPGHQLTRRTLTPREDEADAIRWAYDVLLSGGTLGEIARGWNARGLAGPQNGTPWTSSKVRLTLRVPRLAGLVTYQGEVVRGDDGAPVAATWEPVVDLDTWQAGQEVLGRRRREPQFVAPFLLSGVALCDVCGAKINSGGTRRAAGGKLQRRLRCSAKGGHVYRAAEMVEDYVEDELLMHLVSVDPDRFRPATPGADLAGLRAEVAGLHARGQALAALFAEGTLTADELRAAKARIAERLQQVEAEVAVVSEPSSALAGLITAFDIWKTWERLTLEQRRQVLRETAEVRLLPPGTKENARVWRDAEWDAEGALVRSEGWYCNPATVQIRWLV